MADTPVAAYQVKQSGGMFKLVGDTYGTAPYGLALPKSANSAPAVLAALKVLEAERHVQVDPDSVGGRERRPPGVPDEDQRRDS